MEQNIRRVAFCPHCGNQAPQRLLVTQGCAEGDWIDVGENTEQIDLPCEYFVASCETCEHVLLYCAVGDIPVDRDFIEASLLWPGTSRLDSSVPPSLAAVYAEAARIKQLAPNAFAVQIRRALEAICEDRSAAGHNLHQKLADLAGRGEIPPLLVELTAVLRLLGNIGAHAAASSVKPWQVHAIDEFFRAVVEYVYVAPSRLAKFRDSLESREGDDSPDPDI